MQNAEVEIDGRELIWIDGRVVGVSAGVVRVTVDGENVTDRQRAVGLLGERAEWMLGDASPGDIVPAMIDDEPIRTP